MSCVCFRSFLVLTQLPIPIWPLIHPKNTRLSLRGAPPLSSTAFQSCQPSIIQGGRSQDPRKKKLCRDQNKNRDPLFFLPAPQERRHQGGKSSSSRGGNTLFFFFWSSSSLVSHLPPPPSGSGGLGWAVFFKCRWVRRRRRRGTSRRTRSRR